MKNGKTVLALAAGVAVGALAAKVIEDINDKKSLQKGGDLNKISTVPSYFF
jgi:parvulin-like peptidyl-prolyl isomerase